MPNEISDVSGPRAVDPRDWFRDKGYLIEVVGPRLAPGQLYYLVQFGEGQRPVLLQSGQVWHLGKRTVSFKPHGGGDLDVPVDDELSPVRLRPNLLCLRTIADLGIYADGRPDEQRFHRPV